MANRILYRVIAGVLISIILGFYHDIVKADTYPAVKAYRIFSTDSYSQDAVSVCLKTVTPQAGNAYYDILYTTNITYCRTTVPPSTTINSYQLPQIMQCLGGGTLISNSCVDAPPCISPGVRSTAGFNKGACVQPVQCDYPLTDNGSGTCTNNACPVGEYRVPSTNQCAVPVQCNTTTETYNSQTNHCDYILTCSAHRHVVANECVWDDPIHCPDGQYDDGTYTCVANKPLQCAPGWTYGYINGIPQCIEPSHLDTKQQASKDAAIASNTAQNNLTTAQQTYEQAQLQYNSDPSNVTNQENLTNAASGLGAAQTAANNADAVAKAAKEEADRAEMKQSLADNANGFAKLQSSVDTSNNYLKSIDDDHKLTRVQESAAVSKGIGVFGTIPEDAGIHQSTVNVPTTLGSGSGGGSSGSGGCPASPSISAFGMTIQFPLEMICGLVESMRPVMLAMAYLTGGFIVMAGTI